MKIKNQIIVTLLALLVGVGLSACKDDIQRNPNLSYARGGQDAVEQEEAPEKSYSTELDFKLMLTWSRLKLRIFPNSIKKTGK